MGARFTVQAVDGTIASISVPVSRVMREQGFLVRFFLGIEVRAISPFASDTLVLGESELGVDWVLGPSERFARYAFNVEVERLLSPAERQRLRTLVEYLKPAHTHFVDLVEPLPPVVPEHWELGLSELGETTTLH
ncbi:hypothetical protein ACLESO_36915 [Pyxidicoccus sp. 3LG]